MNEAGSLFDVPPAAIGRYLVRQPLGTGTTGPVFQAQDPASNALVAIKLLKVDLSPDDAHGVAQALAHLVGQMPRHAALAAPLDAGLDETEAYFVTAFVEGDSLESALRDFGPAAIEDLVPRLRSLAGALDLAHEVGLVHGALHPKDILVSQDATHLTGTGVAAILAKAGVSLPLRRPYSAPEVATGTGASAAADQFSLAAIVFEWLFGRRISGPAERLVEVRALPGVDRDALSNAFTIALAPDAETRFASCTAFAEAVAGAVEAHGMPAPREPEAIPVAIPVRPARAERVDEVAWNTGMAAPAKPSERFGGGALIASLIVGLIAGFAAGYMAKPRALQNPPLAGSSGSSGSAGSTGSTDSGGVITPPTEKPVAARPQPIKPVERVEPAPAKAATAGRLLVRSNPSGATVQVDGVTRGVTPLALRDLALGSRHVVVARRGYIAEDRRVVLTSPRPSRSLEVRLTADTARGAPPPPSTPATLGRPAGASASTGALAVESRPPGASVMINGRPSGTTPLTLEALAPGEYRVALALPGYQSFATTVRVVAGERARAAASLSVQERE